MSAGLDRLARVDEEVGVPATLRSLIADPRFGLRPVVNADSDTDLSRPVTWAHSSDLPDPTPWLEAGQLLLTNGAQLPRDCSAAVARTYIERLVDSAVGGLAFATDVVHDHVPAVVVEACRVTGLPLLEVADRTPFISIIRHVADTIAQEQRERLEWSLSAQRALARAALRPDGLMAVLLELQRQLQCWVALYDAAGTRVPVRGVLAVPSAVEGEVAASVRTVLERGHRAGMRLSAAGGDVTLQTLGQRDRLRGVLAVGTATPLDPAGSDLVASVIGLASISIEQSRTLDAAREDLRSGLLELMVAGAVETAAATAERVGDLLPSAPLRVAVVDAGPKTQVVRELLQRQRSRAPARFVAARADQLVALVEDRDGDGLAAGLEELGVAAGISAAGPWTDLRELLAEAQRALAWRGPSGSVTRFESMLGDGMLGLLGDRGGAEVAHRLLQPLHDHPDGDVLLESMRVWLDHACSRDPAARELGVHRHTLGARMRTVERLVGLDLSGPGGRSELWLALQLDPG
jgi:purine catabolism regulator